MIIAIAVLLFIVVPRPNNDNSDTYQELFDAYSKKQGYYDVEQLLLDEFEPQESEYAQRIFNRIQDLHSIQQNKIDSLNNIIENGN